MPQVSPDEAVTRAAVSLDGLDGECLRCYYAARPFKARQLGFEYAHTLLPRLVDTSIHELGWLRGKAIRNMWENTR